MLRWLAHKWRTRSSRQAGRGPARPHGVGEPAQGAAADGAFLAGYAYGLQDAVTAHGPLLQIEAETCAYVAELADALGLPEAVAGWQERGEQLVDVGESILALRRNGAQRAWDAWRLERSE
jgi:hypothetical protein